MRKKDYFCHFYTANVKSRLINRKGGLDIAAVTKKKDTHSSRSSNWSSALVRRSMNCHSLM